MTVRAEIINEILSKIDNISDDQLERVLSYIQKIEKLTSKKKTILSFAGSWKDLDKDTFDSLTDNLHKNRIQESDSDQ